MEALNEQTAQMVASTYGDDYSFEIKEISYTKVEDGYISLITYQLEDGTIGNYGITNSNEVVSHSRVDDFEVKNIEVGGTMNYSEDKSTLMISSSLATTKSTAGIYGIVFSCHSASNCKPCQVMVAIPKPQDPDDKPIQIYSCTEDCEDCKLQAVVRG